MTRDAFKDRERALENEFFHRVDEELLLRFKAKLAADGERRRLEAAAELHDEELLSELLEIGVSAEAVVALSVVPLVLVAWADGKVDTKERPQILKAASEQGIAEASPAAALLEHWLDTKPGPQLESTWKHYVRTTTEKMSDDARNTLRNDVVRRARAVARASGGTLRLGVISSDEKRVIRELELAFDS